ncbi:hypothetical protein [Actinoplanes regularis]|uniref:hypothetical protein n=1 Tax=Actinoplanes regularis TaxID=52697 RepID=UPI0024A59917|nr:hypothetical protein [Actinoplanes regularis]GLW31185.1 hypothetical protein Areg01_41250 [Actinoplanes regularis]
MTGIAVSEAAFELIGACAHALRFAVGAPLDRPYAKVELSTTNPAPALYRRLQVVSPPPTRDGEPWQSGLTLDDKPFEPSELSDRLAEVQIAEGTPSLDLPDPQWIVLDRWIAIPRQRATMEFSRSERGRQLLSVQYWHPLPEGVESVTKEVEFHGTYRMDFDHPPADDWIAVSFDAFWPPERDSADVLIPLGDCDENCPS